MTKRPAEQADRSFLANKMAGIGLKTLVVLALLVAWQIYSRHVSPILMPSPGQTFAAAVQMIETGKLLSATAASLSEFVVGYGLAIVIGLVMGILFGRIRLFAVMTEHVFNALYVTPQLALLPLIVLWTGLGFETKVVIIFLTAFFPIMFNTADGVRQVSRTYVEVAIGYGADERQVLREVMLPAVFPSMMTGLRLGAGRGLTGMVVAEIFTAIHGLGGIIVTAGNQLETAQLFVPIFVLGILGMLIIQGGSAVEGRLVAWKKTERAF